MILIIVMLYIATGINEQAVCSVFQFSPHWPRFSNCIFHSGKSGFYNLQLKAWLWPDPRASQCRSSQTVQHSRFIMYFITLIFSRERLWGEFLWDRVFNDFQWKLSCVDSHSSCPVPFVPSVVKHSVSWSWTGEGQVKAQVWDQEVFSSNALHGDSFRKSLGQNTTHQRLRFVSLRNFTVSSVFHDFSLSFSRGSKEEQTTIKEHKSI